MQSLRSSKGTTAPNLTSGHKGITLSENGRDRCKGEQKSDHSPPGSPHPVHITSSKSPPSRSHHLSLPQSFTLIDLKLICFINPFLSETVRDRGLVPKNYR